MKQLSFLNCVDLARRKLGFLTKTEQLENAITDGDIEAVKKLLRSGALADGFGDSFRPLEHLIFGYASVCGRTAEETAVGVRMLDALLAAGANPNLPDTSLLGGAINLADCGEPEYLASLIKWGADVAYPGCWQMTPLLHALTISCDVATEMLLKAGASAPENEDGKNALHYATVYGALPSVKLLLANGWSPRQKDKVGNTPLYYACRNGNAEIAATLLAAGADPNDDGGEEGAPLVCAVSLGNAECVRLLLEAGARADERLPCGHTHLHHAASGEYCKPSVDVVRLLLQAGADVNARVEAPCRDASGYEEVEISGSGVDGFEAGIFCIFFRLCPIIYSVFKDDGATALHLAAKSESPDVCELLISSGADINALDACGKKPIQRAYGRTLAYFNALEERDLLGELLDVEPPQHSREKEKKHARL